MDYVVSSYTPTLTALLRARQNTRTYSATQMRLLLVTAERAQDQTLPPLRHVAEEAQNITKAASSAGAFVSLQQDQEAVLTALVSSNVVHMACHGVQHRTEPHKSHFCLSSGNLSVSELMGVDLKHAFFAFLSACETAKGNRKHADEVVHLAATMLFAGFKSIIATMW
jgi:CHAT domain-containing protein